MTPLQFREARLAFGLTQSEWGLCLGIGREHVAKIETGRAPVSKTLALLVSAYKRHGLPASECKGLPPLDESPAKPR